MIGKTISQYKILEKVGGGGMGVVYKARDTKLDRFVALKFLPPHMGQSEKENQRFIHEAKAASTIVRIRAKHFSVEVLSGRKDNDILLPKFF